MGPFIWGPNGTAECLAPNGIIGVSGGVIAPATEISYTPSGLLTSINSQTAMNEIAAYAGANPLNYIVGPVDEMTWGNESLTPCGPLGLVPAGSAGGGPSTPSSFTGSLAGRIGVMGLGLGTSSNNTANAFIFSDYYQLYAGQVQTFTLYFGIYTPTTIADGTNDWGLELGFRNSLSASAGNNSMCIKYNRTTSANWMGYTSNNGTSTNVTTANAAMAVTAAAYWNFKIVITSGSVSFYAAVPGAAFTLIGSSSTNLPDATHPSYMCFIIYKLTTFAVQRIFGIDYIVPFGVLATAR